MKGKRTALLLLALLCLFGLFARPASADAHRYVYDGAGLLTAEEQGELEAAAAEISARYDCGVYIVTVERYSPYGATLYGAAERIYEENGLGHGADHSGLMLLLSMSGRDYDLTAHGYGNTAFTDYGKEKLARKFLDDFKRDKWAKGFADYIKVSGDYLKKARDGKPVDIDAFHMVTENFKDSFGTGGMIVLIAAASLLSALISCSNAKKHMKNVKKAADAEFFAVPNSLNLTFANDEYTHTTETQVRIEDDNSRSGGGSRGGTSVNSSGYSHSSGKF